MEKTRNSYRLRHALAKITHLPRTNVRTVDYEVVDRGDGEEITTPVTNISDPEKSRLPSWLRPIMSAKKRNSFLLSSRRTSAGRALFSGHGKPELVEQEVWGLLLTHYRIRHLMCEVAD